MGIILSLGKILRKLLGGTSTLIRVEKNLLNKYGDADVSPIFIIGLPRSGSTLLYQLLISKYKFSFFSNLTNVFYRYPVLILTVFRKKHIKINIDTFNSDYGYIKGIFSPSEGGGIYRSWFGEGIRQDKDVINKTIDAYTKIVGAPFISKNLNFSFHIGVIQEIFPNAFFILVKRDLRYVSQSIYYATKYGEGIHIDGLTKEVLLRKEDILADLSMDLKTIDEEIHEKLYSNVSNFMSVDYSDLCSSPNKVLDNIYSMYMKYGHLEKRDEIIVYPELTESKKVKLSSDEWERLEKILGCVK